MTANIAHKESKNNKEEKDKTTDNVKNIVRETNMIKKNRDENERRKKR